MSSLIRNKRRAKKLVTPGNSSFSNCVQDHLFIQPIRGSLDNFKPVVYLDALGRKHGRVSDHLLQREIESDRQKLKKQPVPKVDKSSSLYGIRNPNIVALVKDVPADDTNEDEEEIPANDEVKYIEYKKPSKSALSDTKNRQASSTTAKESVKFERTDDVDSLDGDEDDEDFEPTKSANNLNARGPSGKLPDLPKDQTGSRPTSLSRIQHRPSQDMYKPPGVEDINDAGSSELATSNEQNEERIKSASSRPKTALSMRSRSGTDERKSSRTSSASTSSDDTSALLRSDNDDPASLTDNDANNEEEQAPIETPVNSDHSNSIVNDVLEIVEPEHISPEPIDTLTQRNAKGEYDTSRVIQLKESFQPIINEAASYGHLDVVRQLLESGQSVHTQNLLERTPLHDACASGNAQLVSELVENGAMIDQSDCRGMTPLHVAASHGSTKCIRVLYVKGCDINAQDTVGRTAVHYSAMHDHVDALKYLLNVNQIDLSITANDSKFPIHYAAKNGSKNVLNLFFQLNLMIHAADMNGNTIAHEACEYNQLDCVKLIWKKNRNLMKDKNQFGRTPIHTAALFGSASVLHWLLELNFIDIDQPDNDGYTMAHLAASRGQGECFACLLMHGVQLDLYTFDRQESVLETARRSGKNGRIEQARSGTIRCHSCDQKLAKTKYDQAHARNAVEQLIHTQIQRGYHLSVPTNRSSGSLSQRNHSTT